MSDESIEERGATSKSVKTSTSVREETGLRVGEAPQIHASLAALVDPPKAEDPPPKIASPVDKLYAQFVEVFGNSNPKQVFSLIWPGTVLDAASYQGWEPGQPLPPDLEINQSRLFDQYYPVATITQPDGTRVSDRYQQAIERYGPVPNAAQLKLEAIIRDRLQQMTSVYINGKDVPMTLLDKFSYLQSQWVARKRAWAEAKSGEMRRLRESGAADWWNRYITWYEDNAESYIDAINESYDRLIAEFPLNAFEDAMAILDTHEAAALLRAKADIRNASAPVPRQMGSNFVSSLAVPADWGSILTPSTRFTDLLAAPDAQQRYMDLVIAQLQQQIFAWNAILAQIPSSSKAEIAQALAEFNTASQKYAEDTNNLISIYTANTLTAVKIYMQYSQAGAAKKAEGATKVQDNLNLQGGGQAGKKITPEDFEKIAKQIQDGQDKLVGATGSMVSAGQDLAAKASAYLNSRAGEGLREIIAPALAQLTEQLALVLRQSQNFNSVAQRTIQMTDEGVTPITGDPAAVPGFPSTADSAANQRWTEVTLTVSTEDMKQEANTSTSFSQTNWQVDFFFGSAGGQSKSASADFASKFMDSKSEIQIGMLATKVLIDRPWMHPEIFNLSKGFYRVSPDRVTTPDPKTFDWTRGRLVPGDLNGDPQVNRDEAARACAELSKGPFPAYPVALLLVKDVTIKIKCSVAATSALQHHAERNSTGGGGFLCFSVSSTQSSTEDRKSASSYAMAGDFVFRITAPQIAGAWLQITPDDQSQVLTEAEARRIADSLGFLGKLQATFAEGHYSETPPAHPTA
ncbi:MAG: hypothetical protein DI570_10395 [Phenylobacterium zucineum]|nr:MAG: hypothetical protein DI570_10395 [Phenylobacterium zucineum]